MPGQPSLLFQQGEMSPEVFKFILSATLHLENQIRDRCFGMWANSGPVRTNTKTSKKTVVPSVPYSSLELIIDKLGGCLS